MNAVEAQDVGSERAQTRKDARIAADAAGVLGEASGTDIVPAILNVPVYSDRFGTLSDWRHNVADDNTVSLLSRPWAMMTKQVEDASRD